PQADARPQTRRRLRRSDLAARQLLVEDQAALLLVTPPSPSLSLDRPCRRPVRAQHLSNAAQKRALFPAYAARRIYLCVFRPRELRPRNNTIRPQRTR